MLTEKDIEELLRNPAPETRASLARKMAETFETKLTTHEIDIARDIVRKLASDIAVLVRQSVAENLRMSPQLPHDVAVRLAQDVTSVALPILENSPVLTDSDLIAIIKQTKEKDAPAKHTGIAKRLVVSAEVSETLVDRAGEQAVAALVANPRADIEERDLARVVDRFASSPLVQEKLVYRPKLPVTLAERMVTLVSDNLRDYLVTHHSISPKIVADVVLQSREHTTVSFVSHGAAERDVENLVLHMRESGRLTPSLILRALCLGEVRFFESALAVLANVPIVNARILIHDAQQLGFKSIYRKTGLPDRLFPAMSVALSVLEETLMDGGKNDQKRFRRRVIERILTQYQDMSDDDINYLLGYLSDLIPDAVA